MNKRHHGIKKLVLAVSCAALAGCSSARLSSSSPYPITAELNNEPWYGKVQAVEIRSNQADPCTQNKFLLYAYTDLPYQVSEWYSKRFEKPTGCLEDCSKTQSLLIDFIPLKTGKHKLYKLDNCFTGKRRHSYFAFLIPRVNSGVVRGYYRETKRNNWIRITRYDPVSKEIEGEIRMSLAGDPNMSESDKTIGTADQIRFRNAVFRTTLTKSLDLGKLKPPGGGEE